MNIEKVGRRFYFRGAPFSAKNLLRDGGAKWDPDERSWWTGKAESAKDLAEKISAMKAEGDDRLDRNARILKGRVAYQGKTYLLLADGVGKNGPYAKLAYMDGSVVFWAKDALQVRVVTRYQEPMSLADIQAFAARKAQERSTGECSCRCHHEHNAGAPGTTLYDGCDRCGCEG